MARTADPDGSPAARFFSALGRLGCTPPEALALLLLASAAVAGLGLLWWSARPPVAGTAERGMPPGSGEQVEPGGPRGPRGPDGEADPADGTGLAVRPGVVVVHVAGRVHAPGLYELPGGSRVADALAAAGGPLEDALLDHVNLARAVADGEQLRVPGPDDVAAPAGQGSAPSGGGGAPGGPSAWRPDGTVDLNLATAADLQELPGIGPVLAARIVAHREEHGSFTSVGELRQVAGIGERTFQTLADLVSV